MKIGELARRVGVTPDTLRFYEKRGLIHADRWPNGYRDFSEATEARVRLLRLGQSLGFSLTEIGDLLDELGTSIDAKAVEELLRGKLAEIDARMAAMAQLRGMLEARLEQVCPLGLGPDLSQAKLQAKETG